MSNLTTELKVGIFVLVALVMVVGSYVWSFDGVRADEASYLIDFPVESADGVYVGTEVRLAGVEIGAVESVEIRGGHAVLALRVREAYRLSIDTEGELKSSGLLGDSYVRLYPGIEDATLSTGSVINERSTPGDLDTITRNLETVSEDIAAITKVLREMAENRDNKDHIEASLANIDGLTEELKNLASRNSADIDAIVDSVRRLSESLEGYASDIAEDVDEEMDKVKELTDELNESAQNITSITDKIDRGEGTIGALVNERDTVDNLNKTVKGVNNAVGSLFGLRPELYYIGRFYAGTQPADTAKFPTGNDLHGSGSNTIGLNLRSHNDFWYTIELVDHPQGVVTQREVYRESTGTYETRWIRERGFKFSFFVNKRWGPASFRMGLIEGGGGAGVTFWTWRDRIQFGAEVFSFRFGSYPAVAESGIPNTRAYFRIEPLRNIYLELGAEQIILGAKNGFFTGYVGLGFHFKDDNLRGVFAAVPSGAL